MCEYIVFLCVTSHIMPSHLYHIIVSDLGRDSMWDVAKDRKPHPESWTPQLQVCHDNGHGLMKHSAGPERWGPVISPFSLSFANCLLFSLLFFHVCVCVYVCVCITFLVLSEIHILHSDPTHLLVPFHPPSTLASFPTKEKNPLWKLSVITVSHSTLFAHISLLAIVHCSESLVWLEASGSHDTISTELSPG